ncbi:hypothetical protein [Desulfatitalea alkaliphila]|uniref:DNA-binding protein n=1 Tax=Desulfatitalea alkaliphila TaxID=2929485 RepID=A0AA41UL21_9BACT|nr:hypothetical protein [Desulfatitalea alkaliphila]MCJ8501031.1 hypothetical protein [Desulfatitalea alkaliphila]
MNQYLPTSKFAESLGVKNDSVRRGLCVKGHYLGVRPVKLPNGRLMWPAKAVEQLLQLEKE